MSIVAISGAILLPISPFVMVAFAVVFTMIAVVNEIHTRNNKHYNVVSDIHDLAVQNLEQENLASNIALMHKNRTIDNKYNIVILIIKASIILFSLYSIIIAIAPIATFLRLSAAVAIILIPVCIGLSCFVAIAGLFLIHKLENSKQNFINRSNKNNENDIAQNSQKHKFYNKLWLVFIINYG